MLSQLQISQAETYSWLIFFFLINEEQRDCTSYSWAAGDCWGSISSGELSHQGQLNYNWTLRPLRLSSLITENSLISPTIVWEHYKNDPYTKPDTKPKIEEGAWAKT